MVCMWITQARCQVGQSRLSADMNRGMQGLTCAQKSEILAFASAASNAGREGSGTHLSFAKAQAVLAMPLASKACMFCILSVHKRSASSRAALDSCIGASWWLLLLELVDLWPGVLNV